MIFLILVIIYQARIASSFLSAQSNLPARFSLYIWIFQLNLKRMSAKSNRLRKIGFFFFSISCTIIAFSEEVDNWFHDLYEAMKNRPHKVMDLQVLLFFFLKSCFAGHIAATDYLSILS